MRKKIISTFYEEHRSGLYNYALLLSGCSATAEDAVHTAICKLLQRPVLPRTLKPYTYRCIRNALIDQKRKNAQSQPLLPEQQATAQPVHGNRIDAEQALALLDPDVREIVTLKTIDGLTFKEISKILNTSINTAASKYRRGIQKIQDNLEE